MSKREVRKTVGKVLGKKTAYYLEFYLIDNHGYEDAGRHRRGPG